jgi:hypothetical protein
MTELKIERDPWDKYTLLDAQYYLPLLINNLFLRMEEQILIVHLVLYMIKTDQISYFDMPQNELIHEYLDYCRNTTYFLNNKNAVEYLEFVIGNSLADENQEENLNYLAQNFFEELKRVEKLLPYKKDYFN